MELVVYLGELYANYILSANKNIDGMNETKETYANVYMK